MRGFKLDNSGDTVISGRDIEMLTQQENTAQKLRTLLGTKQKDWFLDWEEGIDMDAILGKYPGEEKVKDVVLSALLQLDESFHFLDFSCNLDRETRCLSISFSAQNSEGKTVEGVKEWA